MSTPRDPGSSRPARDRRTSGSGRADDRSPTAREREGAVERPGPDDGAGASGRTSGSGTARSSSRARGRTAGGPTSRAGTARDSGTRDSGTRDSNSRGSTGSTGTARTGSTRAARTSSGTGSARAGSERAPSAAARTRGARSAAGDERARGRVRTLDVAERGAGGRWPVPERSVLATVLGVSPLLAVGVAAGLTGLGVLVDLLRIGTLGTVFTICYVGGCVLAVAWVRRRSLFGPMVQPPLLLAVAVPVVVLLAGSPRPGTGISERLLTIGAPLVNSFPTMAWTTAAVLALGTGRLLGQRGQDEAVSAPRGRDGARGAGRRSASPRRS